MTPGGCKLRDHSLKALSDDRGGITERFSNQRCCDWRGVFETSLEDDLQKGMATNSSILTWRVPTIEESGRLQSWGHKESDTTERLSLHWRVV